MPASGWRVEGSLRIHGVWRAFSGRVRRGARVRCGPGLKRLRKEAEIRVNGMQNIPQGLKPSLILLHLRHD